MNPSSNWTEARLAALDEESAAVAELNHLITAMSHQQKESNPRPLDEDGHSSCSESARGSVNRLENVIDHGPAAAGAAAGEDGGHSSESVQGAVLRLIAAAAAAGDDGGHSSESETGARAHQLANLVDQKRIAVRMNQLAEAQLRQLRQFNSREDHEEVEDHGDAGHEESRTAEVGLRSRQRLSSDADDARRQGKDLTKHLPAMVLLSLLEWLAIPDLLAVGAVDCSFRDLTSKEVPWKAAARHLWKSALMEGKQLLSAEAAGVHETARAANVTLQDICRSMVGAWPTYVDDSFRMRQGTRLQALVDGAIQPFYSPLEMLLGPSPDDNGGGSGSGSSDSSSGGGGGGGDGGGGRSSNGCCCDGDACLVSRKKNPGLCSGVVFRGPLGGDRAVRANVPFPFMGTMDTHRNGTRFKPSEEDFSRGRVIMTAQTVYKPTVQLQYPDELLARVKADAPFSLLWPGHHAPDGKDPSMASAEGGGGSGGGGSEGDGAAGATHPAASGVRRQEELRLELERLPSSGPAPFFHAGYTAYFEITLGKTVPPLDRQEGDEIRLECVAIGLANDLFRLERKQPGWDRNSWGFHSDDGRYHHRAVMSDVTTDPSKFGPGDTVGCGLLYPRGLAHFNRRLASDSPAALPAGKHSDGDGAIFFTKNGRFLGIAFRHVNVKRPLYPVIGLDSHCLVTANFGAKAFAFDVPAFESWFTGTKLNCYAPSAPEGNDKRTIIGAVYSARNGFINPRLLCPYIRLTDMEKEGGPRKGGGAARLKRSISRLKRVLGHTPHSQSTILRESLRACPTHEEILSDFSDTESDLLHPMNDVSDADELEEEEEEEDDEDEEEEEDWDESELP